MKRQIALHQIQLSDLQTVVGQNLNLIKLLNGVLLNDYFLGNSLFTFNIL